MTLVFVVFWPIWLPYRSWWSGDRSKRSRSSAVYHFTVLEILKWLRLFLRKAGVPDRTRVLHDWSDNSLEEVRYSFFKHQSRLAALNIIARSGPGIDVSGLGNLDPKYPGINIPGVQSHPYPSSCCMPSAYALWWHVSPHTPSKRICGWHPSTSRLKS